MTTAALHARLPRAAPAATPVAHAAAPAVHETGLARAGVLYCVVEAAAAWGWLHWRANLPSLAPSLAVTMLIRGAFLLLFVSAVSQAWTRVRQTPEARNAACFGAATLLLHAPWTLIVLTWPRLSPVWLGAMAVAAIVTTARLGREAPKATLIAAPYTAWLVCAVIVDVIAGLGRG